MKTLKFLAMLAACAVLVTTTSCKKDKYDVNFIVVDGDHVDKDRLEGVTVKFGSESETTNKNGEASFTKLEEGTHTFTLSKDGYVTQNVSVTISGDNEEVRVTMRLTPADTHAVTFKVTGGGAALSAAKIFIEGDEKGTTNESGEAVINLAEGTYSYKVTKADYDEVSGTVSVTEAREVNVTMTLTDISTPLGSWTAGMVTNNGHMSARNSHQDVGIKYDQSPDGTNARIEALSGVQLVVVSNVDTYSSVEDIEAAFGAGTPVSGNPVRLLYPRGTTQTQHFISKNGSNYRLVKVTAVYVDQGGIEGIARVDRVEFEYRK